MSRYKVTFQNDTDGEITFRHEFKHTKGRVFPVKPGDVHVENMTSRQTFEAFCLLDSAGKKLTGKEFTVDDLPEFTGVVVTKEGDEYILTKVQRTTWCAWLQSKLHKTPKPLSQDETLPTWQPNSG